MDGDNWMNSDAITLRCRAEKSRTAAKKRRDLECKELDRLAAMLPFPEEVTAKLDKGTVLRLTISYLRMKQYTQKGMLYLQLAPRPNKQV